MNEGNDHAVNYRHRPFRDPEATVTLEIDGADLTKFKAGDTIEINPKTKLTVRSRANRWGTAYESSLCCHWKQSASAWKKN